MKFISLAAVFFVLFASVAIAQVQLSGPQPSLPQPSLPQLSLSQLSLSQLSLPASGSPTDVPIPPQLKKQWKSMGILENQHRAWWGLVKVVGIAIGWYSDNNLTERIQNLEKTIKVLKDRIQALEAKR